MYVGMTVTLKKEEEENDEFLFHMVLDIIIRKPWDKKLSCFLAFFSSQIMQNYKDNKIKI